MVQRVATVAFEGIEVRPVDVQVQVAPGMPAFTIVGLPDKAVSEARERVRSALIASGLALPARRITINLAPADLPKEGSHYDLPIALGLMAAIGAIPHDAVAGFTVLGELGLDGSIAAVAGVLPAAIGANARANHRVTYPARFMLVAAMNPCRCGRADEPGFTCRRGLNTRCAADYQGRISGPLLDRIDLQIEVPAVTAADLILPPPTEGSREVAARVAAARERQAARYAAIGLPHIRSNAAVASSVLEDIARPDASGFALLREAAEAMRLSARGYHRVLRVARTLADLDGVDKVGRVHLAEALSYRALADEVRRAA
jgi:predicted ATPase with chaperone activity